MKWEEVIDKNLALINAVELTEEETALAIFEGKRKKFFNLKHKDYWQSLDKTKNAKARTELL